MAVASVAAAVVVASVAAAAAVVAEQSCPPLSAEKNTMNFKNMMQALAVALLLATSPVINAAPPVPAMQKLAQQSFAKPEDAARALAEAVRAEDVNALLAVLGPASRSWLASGDAVADRQDWAKFLAAYDRKNSISLVSDGRAVVLVGEDNWPFPAPLLRQRDRWVFDAAAGREEIINRRIGRNELNTIQTLLAIVDAQREYAVDDLDGNGSNDYARRFVSSEGKRDGLFWPVEANEQPSPLGPLVGAMRTRRLFLNRLDPAHEPVDAVVVIDVLRSFRRPQPTLSPPAPAPSTRWKRSPERSACCGACRMRRPPAPSAAVTRYPVSISATRHRPCRTPTWSVGR
jgi:hypothetical protein